MFVELYSLATFFYIFYTLNLRRKVYLKFSWLLSTSAVEEKHAFYQLEPRSKNNVVCCPTKQGGLDILSLDKFFITLRLRWDGERAKFWSSSWLSGGRSKDIVLNIYAIAKKESISVKEALENDSRVANIDLEQGFDVEHIQ
jgi:hypothetical protein